jgi:pyridoxamine 5'-phosphate oxidase
MPDDFEHADFTLGMLEIESLNPDPIQQFDQWYHDAQTADVSAYHAMTLATCSSSGRPSARVVYLRGFDARGFTFYTNYDSRKGEELAQNPLASLCFFWRELERQVRIEGRTIKVSAAESDAYFAGRPVGSQLGAWASKQSQALESAKALRDRVEELRRKFGDGVIPRPENWGGYRLVPDMIEFWQGRPSRLHDRFAYKLEASGHWGLARLNP